MPALIEQSLIISTGPQPLEAAQTDLIRRFCKVWTQKERRLSTTEFIRHKGVLRQRRRAQRQDCGKKRAKYKVTRKKPEGPQRGLLEADCVALVPPPEGRAASSIFDPMSPPRRSK